MGDLRDGISQTFQECEDCGGYFVKVANHTCEDRRCGGTDPTREERMQRATVDPRPEDDRVAILPTRVNDGAYAYHEIDGDGWPICGGGGVLDDEEWIRLSRGDAKARGKSPCGTCWWLTRKEAFPGLRGRDTGRRSGR